MPNWTTISALSGEVNQYLSILVDIRIFSMESVSPTALNRDVPAEDAIDAVRQAATNQMRTTGIISS